MGDDRPPVPRKSITRRLLSGKTKKFPSATDLLQLCIDRGQIVGVQDFYQAGPEVVSDLAFDWLRYGQVACHFAIGLARAPEDHHWASFVIDGILQGDAAATLALVLDDPDWQEAEALQFILPDIGTSEQLIALINNLCANHRWYWVREPGSRGHASIGLRWILPSNKSVSWVLGFGPFADMPFTRRAPQTMLVVRPRDAHGKEFSGKQRGKELGRSTVHLADMDVSHWTAQRIQRYLDTTTKNKYDYLCNEFKSAARARVTFSLPTACVDLLVSPRRVPKRKAKR